VKRFSPIPKPVTPERIERALDRVAEIIVAYGDEGHKFLPLYDRLEKELRACQAIDQRLADARRRFQRSRDRMADQPS